MKRFLLALLLVATSAQAQWPGYSFRPAGGGSSSTAVGDITGLGTGVATALAVNIGSAGAPVVLNGAGGTPSSLTGTNITGIPPAGVTGTAAILGANTFTGAQTFTATIGNYGGTGAGTGYMGFGSAPQKGFGIYLDGGGQTYTDGEQVGAQFYVRNSPASASTTGMFGVIALGGWGGSADSSAGGLIYGSQNTAQLGGTASIQKAIGAEAIVQSLATAGTMVNARGLWAHVDNNSTGAITNAYAIEANVGGAGSAGITNAIGVQIHDIVGTNAYGIKISDISSGSTLNYAIYTDAGLVRFGGAMSAPSATIPALRGLVTVGDSGVNDAGVTVYGKTGQAGDLLGLYVGGVLKVNVSNSGGLTLTGDTNFGSGTSIYGAGQDVRLGTSGLYVKSAIGMFWTGTTHAYDSADLGISRVSAGIAAVGTGAAGSFAGTLKLTTLQGGTSLTLNNASSGSLTIGSNAVTPASSGTRFLCISTAGVVTSSASACSGT